MKYFAALVLCGALSCVDFDLVAPPVFQPAVNIAVSVLHDSTSRYQLNVNLRLGNDAGGRVNTVSDTTLYVNDEPVQADIRFSVRGNRLYVWEKTQPWGVNPDSLRLRLPVFAVGSSDAFKVSVPIPVRTDLYEMTLNAGEDLRLHVTPALAPFGFSRPDQAVWQLALRPSCEGGGGIQVLGNGPVPDQLRVPWDWLQASTEPLMACLQAFSFFRNDNTPYDANVTLALRVNWRVSISGR